MALRLGNFSRRLLFAEWMIALVRQMFPGWLLSDRCRLRHRLTKDLTSTSQPGESRGDVQAHYALQLTLLRTAKEAASIAGGNNVRAGAAMGWVRWDGKHTETYP